MKKNINDNNKHLGK